MAVIKAAIRVDKIVVRWRPDYSDDEESCQAWAHLSYPINDGSERRLETLSSGGLYGIRGAESEYRAEVAQEEIAKLREHLAVFGMTFTDVEWSMIPREVTYK